VQVKVAAVARVVGAKAADVAKVTEVDGQARREAHREVEGPTRRAGASNSTKTMRLDWKRFSRFCLSQIVYFQVASPLPAFGFESHPHNFLPLTGQPEMSSILTLFLPRCELVVPLASKFGSC